MSLNSLPPQIDADIQKLIADYQLAGGTLQAPASAAPILLTAVCVTKVVPGPFVGMFSTATFSPAPNTTGQPQTFTVTSLPSTLQGPEDIPYNVTLTASPTQQGQYVVAGVSLAASAFTGLLLHSAPDSSSTGVDLVFFNIATNQTLSLHVSAAPTGMAPLDGKTWSFDYLLGTGGALDYIAPSSVKSQ